MNSARMREERNSATDAGAGALKQSSVGQQTAGGAVVPPTTNQLSKKGIEIQDELARIVLVGKGLMEDWRKS